MTRSWRPLWDIGADARVLASAAQFRALKDGLVSAPGTRRIGRYVLCDQVGAGGMASIHLARLHGPQGFARTVAAKRLYPQFAQNPQFVAMFLDEARLAGRVRHGNVISPLDVVTTDSELFIIMDYVNGESLAALLRAEKAPLSPAIASAISVQALLGLHAVHTATSESGAALELVHRDVSPQNILVGEDGVARVIDFGIAKAAARSQVTEEGKLKGKVGYMAPEQLRQDPVDRRADLFTVGIVLWEALTGTRLFAADTLAASVELILRGPITLPSSLVPSVGREIDAVVMRALEREPSERWQDAKSMAAALERAVSPASTLDLVRWVEDLAGPELARKAELVKRAEVARFADEPSTTISERPAGAILVQSAARAASTNTGEVTGVALGSERQTRDFAARARRRQRWFLAVGPALAGALALTFLSRLRNESAEPRPASRPSADFRVPGPAPSTPTLSNPMVPAPSASAAQPASSAGGMARAKPNSALGLAPLPARASPPRPLPSARAVVPRLTPNCSPPWTFTPENVKVFKAECLR